ncbi:hypothetical protein Glove_132g213 [Diversispora epigaea]|uniref:Uncharacterized protein n=1 Tax=Diversispora epigaea TaxID=1348612 RepID=A0A397J6K2_9GLOM|nr:hypothetical protein Glove_132g213 [Diversispora epigaea]
MPRFQASDRLLLDSSSPSRRRGQATQGPVPVAIGALVAKAIEVIKAIEFPRMGPGNLTLDLCFLVGIPEYFQCPSSEKPLMIFHTASLQK